jgi:tryptophanyl-tRNA synthetase
MFQEKIDLANENMIVTPWVVSGEIDYDKLIQQFGTEPITETLLNRIRKHTGDLHLQLRRRIFFSHRDLNWILDMYEKGERFCLYTGRGPSGDVHIGHVVPWIFTKYLQDKFGAKLYFQLTDDEKFFITPEMSKEKALSLSYENALDVIAIGFDPKKTKFISDMKNAKVMYNIAIDVAKHVTASTAKAVFGFTDSSNIGIIFFPSMQAAPCFVESVFEKKNVPCLIPAAIDQDPYWRIARDVAPKLGYYKPAQIHSIFLPGLGKGGKMSSSMPETCIFTVDSPNVAEKKIMNAFTGGRSTVEEQRKLGADPSICTVYDYERMMFEPNDDKLIELERLCKTGQILCGECKQILAERVKKFLIEHQKRREKAKDLVESYFLQS